MRNFANEKDNYCMKLEDAFKSQNLRQRLPKFLLKVFDAKTGDRIYLSGIKHKDEFIKFLQFAYCEKLVETVTGK